MKVVVALDSFKGSMTSLEAGEAVKTGILNADSHAQVKVKPIADGGEGTMDAFIFGLGGNKAKVTVTNPLGIKHDAYYGIVENGNTAIIEVAQAIGITLIPKDKKNPRVASSYGVGEIIIDAVKKGCTKFIIGLGGSATNDGGIGMLNALGYQFLDKDGHCVPQGTEGLAKVASINSDNVSIDLSKLSFQVACDVENPLCGENGATYIFGPQKGIKSIEMQEIDQSMNTYAQCCEKFTDKKVSNISGAGAAGGLGFAFLCFTKCIFNSGIDMVLNAINLENSLKDSDLVITGEGRLDAQTAMGKAPSGIAKLAKKYNIPVIALAGSIGEGSEICNQNGIDAFFPIVRNITTLEDAMKTENAKENITKTTEQVIRTLKVSATLS